MPDIELNAKQVAFYEENGFVVIEPVFSEAELIALREAADQLLAQSGPVVAENRRLQIEEETHDGKPVVRKIEPINDLVPAFAELAADPRMTAAAAQLLGEPVFLFEDKLNYKPPYIGSAYPLHQDYAYWTKYTDRLITVALHLDDATPENGCLRLVPGSHQQGLIERPAGEARIITWDVDPDLAVDAPGAAGSLVVFSCYTAHHSYMNRSPVGRRAILYTYNPASDGDTYPTYMGPIAQAQRDWLAAQQL
jgi:ectoine hydroxylase-related dioxygenase (phytanoyl-CoA dioxygenase family)